MNYRITATASAVTATAPHFTKQKEDTFGRKRLEPKLKTRSEINTQSQTQDDCSTRWRDCSRSFCSSRRERRLPAGTSAGDTESACWARAQLAKKGGMPVNSGKYTAVQQ